MKCSEQNASWASHLHEYLLHDLTSKFAWFALYSMHLSFTSTYASLSYSKTSAASAQYDKIKGQNSN